MTINLGTATTKNAGCAERQEEGLLVDMIWTAVLESPHQTAPTRFKAAGSLPTHSAKDPTTEQNQTTKLNELET
ncbi:hypothetical protein V0R59_26415 [Pseudomonas sp. 147P]|uniref:hypothetical protein n=1 Tax=Pseudomonas TaxID=286 RepID=UPI002E7B5AB5|nr:hypothetical protein [Pseudomonas sp. 148P]MEE1925530.1 hypothetical protein [Pseudomonas sp. 147P]